MGLKGGNMFFSRHHEEEVKRIIREDSFAAGISDINIILHEINRAYFSAERRWMLDGINYFKGRHDILKKRRIAYGKHGEEIELKQLPNSRIVNNEYRRMVIQKTNYLTGKPFTVNTENDTYSELLSDVFTDGFFRELKNVTRDCLNYGISWLYPYYDERGEFKFKRFDAYEMRPLWQDKDHTILEGAIRFYPVEVFDGKNDYEIYKVEVFTESGIDYYETNFLKLIPVAPYHTDHMTINAAGYNWSKIPLIPFKYTNETPLIVHAKSLQDGINSILSSFEDNMLEDVNKSILILVNYDGQDLAEFKANLAQYGAVKVRTTDGVAGDLRMLSVDVNASNYQLIVDVLRRAIVQNCMGYDATDARFGGNPNQMNIQSVYNDIDLDASDMETEFQASLEQLMFFVNSHLFNTGKGNFFKERVTFTFNTDMPMDESGKISNIMQSVGMVSVETLLARHPYVDDVAMELQRLERQKQAEVSVYDNALPDRGLNDEEDRRKAEEERRSERAKRILESAVLTD